ncbi:hypothetical protein EDB83DRAFT_1706084 [Lactarius deliciosus]|nr:hypothetical protein EDB83DRAFT_1706084 [Lactarius deliciosus]
MFNSLLRRIPFRAGNPRLFTSSASSSFWGSLRAVRALRSFTLATTLGTAAYTVGAFYPPTLVTYIAPRACSATSGPKLARDASLRRGTRGGAAKAANITQASLQRKIVRNGTRRGRIKSLLKNGVSTTWSPVPSAGLVFSHCLPSYAHAGTSQKGFIVVHVGRGLCGHDGLVHGGLLATLLDEASRTDSYAEPSRENRCDGQPLGQLPCADPRRPGNTNSLPGHAQTSIG